MMSSSNIKKLASLFVLTTCSVWIYLKASELAEAFDPNFADSYLIWLAVILSMLIIGFGNQVVARSLGASLNFYQWTCLSFASTLSNLIFPFKAGLGLRAAYYKKKYKLPLTYFTSISIYMQIVSILVNSVVGIAVLFSLRYFEVYILSFLMLTVFICVLLLKSKRLGLDITWIKLSIVISKVEEGWNLVRKNRRTFYLFTMSSICLTMLFAFRLYFSFAVLNFSVNFGGCVLLAVLASISTIIAITPGGLGIREAIIVAGSSILDISPEIALLASGIDRVISMSVIAILGTVGFIKVKKDMSLLKKS